MTKSLRIVQRHLDTNLADSEGQHWTCCSEHVSTKPCGGCYTHTPRAQLLAELVQQHRTPKAMGTRDNVREAVALDCEMGTAISGDSELIRVTLIDYFSGAVLVNNFVDPDVPMQHLNTRFSGVSWLDITQAKRQGRCLAGKAGARAAIWRYVGPDTIVVGYGANNDLRALRWIHELMVDSFVLEYRYKKEKKGVEDEDGNVGGDEDEDKEEDALQTAMGKFAVSGIEMANNDTTTTTQKGKKSTPGRLSLKTLAKERLGRSIQMAGNKGHDSLEDAIAARDLVHWTITHVDRVCFKGSN
jgi:RNA exonuclease 1